jgi:hypothetical protein
VASRAAEERKAAAHASGEEPERVDMPYKEGILKRRS